MPHSPGMRMSTGFSCFTALLTFSLLTSPPQTIPPAIFDFPSSNNYEETAPCISFTTTFFFRLLPFSSSTSPTSFPPFFFITCEGRVGFLRAPPPSNVHRAWCFLSPFPAPVICCPESPFVYSWAHGLSFFSPSPPLLCDFFSPFFWFLWSPRVIFLVSDFFLPPSPAALLGYFNLSPVWSQLFFFVLQTQTPPHPVLLKFSNPVFSLPRQKKPKGSLLFHPCSMSPFLGVYFFFPCP